ncbi:cell division FtsA domain-containing protein [Candidatus Parcubacteria bacterium]|nr:cell division FtsA domain-containing protein [Candidatus Parcubacteria bacterium]
MFSFSKKKRHLVEVFDIGSASVGGLVFEHKEESLPVIISSTRKQTNFSKKMTPTNAWKAIHESFCKVADNIKKKTPERPDMTFCVFSSPWYIAQTRIIKMRKEKEFQVDKKLFDKLIEDEAKIFKSQWQDETWNRKNENTFLEQEVTKTLLNGYTVKNPINKRTPDLKLYAYMSLSFDLFKEKIRNDILTHVKSDSIYFNSFPFVAFEVLKEIADTQKGLVITDISGELTDVFVFRDNIIEEISSFPKGANFFIRRLASGLNLSFEEARSLILEYQRDELDKDYSTKISNILDAASGEWSKYLKKLLTKISEDKYLPQNFYFCGPDIAIKEVKDKISHEDFSRLTIFGKPFEINYLMPESLKHHFNYTESFSSNKDIFLLILSMFAVKFIHNK